MAFAISVVYFFSGFASAGSTNTLATYVLRAYSSRNKDITSASKGETAAAVGKAIAEKATKAGVETVSFDRNGYLYHGRVKVLAEAAREAGLKF